MEKHLALVLAAAALLISGCAAPSGGEESQADSGHSAVLESSGENDSLAEPEEESAMEPKSPSIIELGGEDYFPDGIAASENGTLYVSSMWGGKIDIVPSGSGKSVSFVPPEPDGRTALGLLVDEEDGLLWAVFWDYQGFMSIPAQLKSFDLETGELVELYEFPEGAIGNDLTMDGDGNIYITCSFTHSIFRLEAGGSALEVWSDDPAFSEGHQDGWTLNGIDWDSESSLFVSRTDNDGIYRVSINEDGSAGEVERIIVEGNLSNMGYDGIAALGPDTILVSEYGTNRLTMISVNGSTGTKQVIDDELDFPTNVVVVGDGAWVVESQIDHMLYADTAGQPEEPFTLRYVGLPQN